MTRPTAPTIALLASLLIGFAAPALGEAPCVARAGGEDGIGGTGFGGGEDDSGIGGTGIYGVITGIGSICVNGLHIETPDGLAVTRDGEAASVDALAVGRVVWVSAALREGRLVATEVAIESAVRGSIDAILPEAGRLVVAGIDVDVSDLPPLDHAVGDPIEVSGLWRDDARLVATRIDRVEPAPDRVRRPGDLLRRLAGKRWVSVEGFVSDAARDDGFVVRGLTVEGRSPEPGARVWVRGRLADGRIAPERIEPRPEPSRRAPPRDARPKPTSGPEAPPRRIERPERPPTVDRIDRPPTIDRVEKPTIQRTR